MNVELPSAVDSGWIEVICGCMFSGKTEELIRRIRRAKFARQRVQVFKPIVDSRYSKNDVMSHSALALEAESTEHPEQILERLNPATRIVGIDEAQFFSNAIVPVCQTLANRRFRVIAAGLDMDYRAEPFGPMPWLMAEAEYVTKMAAICVVCGAPATRSYRYERSNSGPKILLGARELYEARCRHCFEKPL